MTGLLNRQWWEHWNILVLVFQQSFVVIYLGHGTQSGELYSHAIQGIVRRNPRSCATQSKEWLHDTINPRSGCTTKSIQGVVRHNQSKGLYDKINPRACTTLTRHNTLLILPRAYTKTVDKVARLECFDRVWDSQGVKESRKISRNYFAAKKLPLSS